MIRLKDTFYIKNVPAPQRLVMKVEAGINGLYSNGKSHVVDLLPYDYIEGGVKSTGRIDVDMLTYCVDILNEIKNTVFFSKGKEDLSVRGKFWAEYSSFVDDEDKNKILDDFTVDDLIKSGGQYITKLSMLKAFNILIRDFDSDINIFNGRIKGCNLFLLLFNIWSSMPDSESYIEYSQYADNTIQLQQNLYHLNLNIYWFIDMLCNIFIYCYSKSRRDSIIARAYYYLNILDWKEIKNKRTLYNNVYLWDNQSKNYYGFYNNYMSDTLEEMELFNSPNYYVKYTNNDYNSRYIRHFKGYRDNSNEYVNRLDIHSRSDDINETHIAKVYNSYGYFDDFVAYRAIESKTSNWDLISVGIEFKVIDSNGIDPLYYFYKCSKSTRPYDDYVSSIHINNNSKLMNIDYFKFNDDSISNISNNLEMEYHVTICYHKCNKPSEFIVSDNSNSFKKLTKPKQKVVIKAFTDLCNELDLDPVKVSMQQSNFKFLKVGGK